MSRQRALRLLLLALAGLATILLVRTARFTSKQVAVEPALPLALDRQALAERLAAALRIETVSHQEQSQISGEAFLAFHRYLGEQYPLVHRRLRREVVNGYSLLYTWEGSEPGRKPIILLSHLDVVPVEPGTEAQWSYPPFAGRIAEGFIWGRGALDDKFGVLGILEAVEALLGSGFQPRTTVYLAFGHDEELGGERGAQEIVNLLQSRAVAAEYVLDEGGALLRGLLPGLAMPVGAIGIAEKGSVSIELSARTEGGHSSAPPPRTAVGLVSSAVHEVERHPLPAELRGATRQLIEHIGPELPLLYRVVCANLWLFGGVLERLLANTPATNATLRTTTAATIIAGGVKENVLPASARAVINFRILPGDSVAGVLEHVRRAVGNPQVSVQALSAGREASAESPTDTAAFGVLRRTIREVYPEALVAPYLTLGATDARRYVALTQNIYRFTPIVGEPSDLARIHGTNERIALEHYEGAVQFFARLIQNSG
ncbi:MAG: M20 family peptidase [Deltaproteobacteria bacterium]|nr:M20 family peptidase [Deltaproteobacteria bacterium]